MNDAALRESAREALADAAYVVAHTYANRLAAGAIALRARAAELW